MEGEVNSVAAEDSCIEVEIVVGGDDEFEGAIR